MSQWVPVAHLAATAMLAGVGWLTQLALYPLFRRVGPDAWAGYHQAHSTALVRTVALPWVVQGATTLALLVQPPSGVPGWLLGLDALLALGPVAITALVAVPMHRRLGAGLDQDLVTALLRANLVRTTLWTAAIGTAGAVAVLAV